jgi:hypothetical protein
MTERTITEQELREAIAELTSLSDSTFYDLVKVAFPPIFKPKEGEVILASDNEDFPVHLFVEFAHMNELNSYVCHHQGKLRTFSYAAKQTPTHKGE